MNLRLAFFVSALLAISPASSAQEDDDLVRLPGQGEVKRDRIRDVGASRLAPGGGLMTSFDTDENGRVSLVELNAGILAAFETADVNVDGNLTPLEQKDWASDLPTRDDSLFNPARFDPNLDRRVSVDEFRSVIEKMAAGYTEEGSDEVVLASLKRDPRRESRQDDDEESEGRPERRRSQAERGQGQRRSRF